MELEHLFYYRRQILRGRTGSDTHVNANTYSHLDSDSNTNGDGYSYCDAYSYTYTNAYSNFKGYTSTEAASDAGASALARAAIVQSREFANRFANCRKARKVERVVSNALRKGHRLRTKDPRTARLFELAREAGVDGVHMQAALAVEKAFADAKKSLPINVDGAIGAILADLGMTPAAFNGIFMIARTPGLIAHVIEEQTREKPMRRIDPVNHGYDGPPARTLITNPPLREPKADK